MSTQHTPTPHLGNGIASAGPWFIADEGGSRGIKRELFDEFGTHAGYELLGGNAAPIVNSHDALVDALHAILFQVTQGKVLERDACITQARAALKAATEQS